MGELRAARALTHCPHAGRRCGKALVYPDVAPLGQFHPRQFQPDTIGVRRTANGDKQISPFDSVFAVWSLRHHAYLGAGFSFDGSNACPEANSDSLVTKELKYRRTDVRIFLAGKLLPLFDDGHARAEAAHGLRQFEPDVAAAHDDQMRG
jgi:hypothetical protein